MGTAYAKVERGMRFGGGVGAAQRSLKGPQVFGEGWLSFLYVSTDQCYSSLGSSGLETPSLNLLVKTQSQQVESWGLRLAELGFLLQSFRQAWQAVGTSWRLEMGWVPTGGCPRQGCGEPSAAPCCPPAHCLVPTLCSRD